MATVSELTSYRGDAGLGLGSNSDVPVQAGKPLEFTNQIIRDIGSREAQKNILKYSQQIKDRDSMLEALSSGQVKVGDTLERDLPVVRTALDEQTTAFKEWMKKGYGDIDGALAYKKATQKANEAVTQAQARKLFYDKESAVVGKEVLPKFAAARKANIEKNLSNFWGDITPFQETSRLQLEPIEKLAVASTEEFTDPSKGPLYKGKRTQFSFDNAMANATQYSLTPDGLNNLQQLHDSFMELTTPEFVQKVKTINKELERYNTEKGLKPGDKDYATPVQAVQGPGGKWMVNEPLDGLAAKISLAGQQKFKTETFDVDKGALDIYQEKEKARHNKAMESVDRGTLGLNWAKFNYAKDEDKYGASSVLNEAADIIKKGQEVDVFNKATKKTEKRLRIGDPTLLKTFGNIDKDGNVTNVPDFVEYNKNKDQLTLGYYDEDGHTIAKEVSLDQRTWLKEIAKRSFPNKDIGKVNTLVDDILNDSGNSLYKLTQQPDLKPTAAGKLVFPDGTEIDLSATKLSDKELKAAMKAGAKRQ